jgi:hypothetical protein
MGWAWPLRVLVFVTALSGPFAAGVYGQSTEFQSKRFSRLISVREISADSVLLVDQLERSVYLLSWDAERVLPGLVGEGPGPLEFRGPGPLFTVDSIRTLMVDSYDGDWLLLDGTRVLEGRRPHLDRVPTVVGVDAGGTVLIGQQRWVPVDSIDYSFTTLEGALLGSAVTTRGMERGGPWVFPGRGRVPPVVFTHSPLDSYPQVVMASDGWVAVAYPHPYRIRWRRPDGTWIDGPILEDASPVTREVRCRAMARVFRDAPCAEHVIEKWPSFVPAFLPRGNSFKEPVVLPTPDGRVIVLRARTGDAGLVYDLINRRGERESSIQLESGVFVLGFGSTYVYLVRTREFELQELSRAPWSTFVASHGRS